MKYLFIITALIFLGLSVNAQNQLLNNQTPIFLGVNTAEEDVPDVLEPVGVGDFTTTCNNTVNLKYYRVAPWVAEMKSENTRLWEANDSLFTLSGGWMYQAGYHRERSTMLDSIFGTSALHNSDLVEIAEGLKTFTLPEVDGVTKVPTFDDVFGITIIPLGEFDMSDFGSFQEQESNPSEKFPDTIVIIEVTKVNTTQRIVQLGPTITYGNISSRLDLEGGGAGVNALYSPAGSNWAYSAFMKMEFLSGTNAINEAELDQFTLGFGVGRIFHKGNAVNFVAMARVGLTNTSGARHFGETWNYERGPEWSAIADLIFGPQVNIGRITLSGQFNFGIGYGKGVHSPYTTPIHTHSDEPNRMSERILNRSSHYFGATLAAGYNF